MDDSLDSPSKLIEQNERSLNNDMPTANEKQPESSAVSTEEKVDNLEEIAALLQTEIQSFFSRLEELRKTRKQKLNDVKILNEKISKLLSNIQTTTSNKEQVIVDILIRLREELTCPN